MRGYMLGRKQAPTAAREAYYDQSSGLLPRSEPLGKGDSSRASATPDPWTSSDDHATVDERSRGGFDDRATVDKRSHGGVDKSRNRYDAIDSCPSFSEKEESIDCCDGSVKVEAGAYFDGKPHVPEDESTSKDKYHTVRDEMEDLTEGGIGEIISWMTKYMKGAVVERVKGKVEDIKEKRLRKINGRTTKPFGKTVVETEAETPSGDLSTSEFTLVPDKIAELQEEMKHTRMGLKRRGSKTFAWKPLGSPFLTRENSAFDRLVDVCEGTPSRTWADDHEDDDTNRIKMEIPCFNGQNVEAFAQRFGQHLVLTGRTKAKS